MLLIHRNRGKPPLPQMPRRAQPAITVNYGDVMDGAPDIEYLAAL
jgi:hypothetical protein